MSSTLPSARQIEYFLAIAEADGFRGAAERLEVSQPTLTNQIGALEQVLGVRLFERSRAGTHLTPEARELLPAARQALAAMQGLVHRAREVSSGPTGTYRLGVTPTLGPYLLPHVLPDLHKRYQHLRLFVREGTPRDLTPGLVDGEFDFVLGPLPIADDRLEVLPLFREPLRLVFPADHALARLATVRRRDLRGHAILVMEEPFQLHQQIHHLCTELGAHLLHNYEGSSLDALRLMCATGMGATILPALYVRSEIRRAHDLRVTDFADEALFRVLALAWRRGSPAEPLFREVAEQLRAFARKALGADALVVSAGPRRGRRA